MRLTLELVSNAVHSCKLLKGFKIIHQCACLVISWFKISDFMQCKISIYIIYRCEIYRCEISLHCDWLVSVTWYRYCSVSGWSVSRGICTTYHNFIVASLVINQILKWGKLNRVSCDVVLQWPGWQMFYFVIFIFELWNVTFNLRYYRGWVNNANNMYYYVCKSQYYFVL